MYSKSMGVTTFLSVMVLFVFGSAEPLAAAEGADQDQACALQTQQRQEPADSTPPGRLQFTLPPLIGTCEDIELDQCGKFKGDGLCSTQSVSWACKRTCALCEAPSSQRQESEAGRTLNFTFPLLLATCDDIELDNCGKYKEDGLCGGPVVALLCKKTCGACHPRSTMTGAEQGWTGHLGSFDLPPMIGTCDDIEVDRCGMYKHKGLCSTDVMSWVCMKTCGACPPAALRLGSPGSARLSFNLPPLVGACEDIELDRCDQMKGHGLCSTQSVSWACKRTCGRCYPVHGRRQDGQVDARLSFVLPPTIAS